MDRARVAGAVLGGNTTTSFQQRKNAVGQMGNLFRGRGEALFEDSHFGVDGVQRRGIQVGVVQFARAYANRFATAGLSAPCKAHHEE